MVIDARSRGRLAVLSQAVFSLVALALPAERLVAQQASRSADRSVAMTIEGGGSLGVYEAGLVWTLTETFRRRQMLEAGHPDVAASPFAARLRDLPLLRLAATSGASAGSINALLAAAQWCNTVPQENAEASTFWAAWIPTGIPQLMPEVESPAWRDKGLFSRRFFDDTVLKAVDHIWKATPSDRACRVPLGVTVTHLNKDSVEVESALLYARSQRYAAAVDVRGSGDEQAPRRFHPLDGVAAATVGPERTLVLGRVNDTIPFERGIGALVESSSGYPLAFAPFDLRVCPRRSLGAPACDASESKRVVDGGVFDNGPILLGYRLARSNGAGAAEVAMLYVRPGRRRHTGGRKDQFGVLAEKAAAHAPDGLDAVMRLISNFIPTGRQYELQIASRELPHDTEDESRRHELAALRRELAGCLVSRGSECRAATAADSGIVRSGGANLDSVDPVYSAGADSARKADRLFVTSRFHSLAGDWMSGFGGLISRALREYDFYVGMYDGLSFIARDVRCRGDSVCAVGVLRELIERPPVPVSVTATRMLHRLYDIEYAGADARTFDATTLGAVTRTDSLLLAIADAFAARLDPASIPKNRCAKGGAIEKVACREGITAFFQVLHEQDEINDLVDDFATTNHCGGTVTASTCLVDKRFRRFMHRPIPSTNRLFGDLLSRADVATPDSGAMKPMILLTQWLFHSTNNRARGGFDGGSVSMPRVEQRRCTKALKVWLDHDIPGWWKGCAWVGAFALVPSTAGFAHASTSPFFEWTLRFHVDELPLIDRSVPLAAGLTAKVMRSSSLVLPDDTDRLWRVVPGARLEYKRGGVLSTVVSAFSADAQLWPGPRKEWGGAATGFETPRATVGGSIWFLANHIRVSFQRTPRGYAALRHDGTRRETLVDIGLVDPAGLLYWGSRLGKTMIGR